MNGAGGAVASAATIAALPNGPCRKPIEPVAEPRAPDRSSPTSPPAPPLTSAVCTAPLGEVLAHRHRRGALRVGARPRRDAAALRVHDARGGRFGARRTAAPARARAVRPFVGALDHPRRAVRVVEQAQVSRLFVDVDARRPDAAPRRRRRPRCRRRSRRRTPRRLSIRRRAACSGRSAAPAAASRGRPPGGRRPRPGRAARPPRSARPRPGRSARR